MQAESIMMKVTGVNRRKANLSVESVKVLLTPSSERLADQRTLRNQFPLSRHNGFWQYTLVEQAMSAQNSQ